MKLASVLLAVGCWLSAASALQPGFDAQEVVRQMRGVVRPASGIEQSLDDGEFLVDTSAPGPSPGHYGPVLGFDGANFLIVWQDERNGGRHIHGARVSTGGQVLEQYAVAGQPAGQYVPRLAHGSGSQLLFVYEGWTADYRGQTFNTDHIWGKFSPLAGVGEGPRLEVGDSRPAATIVRGVLVLGAANSRQGGNARRGRAEGARPAPGRE